MVSYCLYISVPDPIRYGLYFERFMDPDRDEMPDIDLDICQNGRSRVIEYVRQKYGHVAQIITFGTLKARAAIKDVARVMGLGFEEANQLTKLIPNELKMTLDKALHQEPELKKRYDSDPTVRRIIDIGRRLEGVARNAGIHAAGVVVADQFEICRAGGALDLFRRLAARNDTGDGWMLQAPCQGPGSHRHAGRHLVRLDLLHLPQPLLNTGRIPT